MLYARIITAALGRGSSPCFRLGMFLFLLNWPVGYGGLALCWLLAWIWKSNFWAILVGCFYALSWLMLGSGLLLAGAGARTFFRNICRRKRAAWQRLRTIRAMSESDKAEKRPSENSCK